MTKELGRLQEARAEVEAENAEMAPLKEAVEGIDTQTREIRDRLRDIGVKMEDELDAKIEDMDFRIQHEGVDLREEKRMVQEMKRLRSMRESIRTLSAQ